MKKTDLSLPICKNNIMRKIINCLLLLLAASAVQAQGTPSVSWNVSPDNPFYLKNDPGNLFLYVDLKGQELLNQKKRAPLNISIVIDRSGSMSGDKIKYARQAAMFVVDQLGSDDYVSVVQYDNSVEVVSASATVQNKEILKSKIEKIFDRGSTNMTGGMLKGYDEVLSTKKEGYVNRVLLMTDGLANVGITDSAQICKIAEKKCKENGIGISTFGIGADYNENLLTAIAETGCGSYYYIDSPDKIPGIFAKELEGLLSVVAQNLSVDIAFPNEFLKCEKVYGYPFTIKDNKVNIQFNDLYSKEEKAVVIQFSRLKNLPDQVNYTAGIGYTDAQTLNVVKEEKKITLQSHADPLYVMKFTDTLVDDMVVLYKSTEMFDEVLLEIDKGNFVAAKAKADAAKVYVAAKAVTTRSEKLKTQSVKIKEYADNIEKYKAMSATEQKSYQKANKSANYKMKKGKN
jgi:Ca-activated chloride channel homolog